MPETIDIDDLHRSTVSLFAARILHYWMWVTFFIGLVVVGRIKEHDVKSTVAGMLLIVLLVCIISDRIGRNWIRKMARFSRCFELKFSDLLDSEGYGPRPDILHPSTYLHHSRGNFLRADYLCDGYAALSNTYGDKKVAKRWRIFKKTLLPLFIVVLCCLFVLSICTLGVLVYDSHPDYDEILHTQLVTTIILLSAVLLKFIGELICFLATFRWIKYRRENHTGSIMNGWKM